MLPSRFASLLAESVVRRTFVHIKNTSPPLLLPSYISPSSLLPPSNLSSLSYLQGLLSTYYMDNETKTREAFIVALRNTQPIETASVPRGKRYPGLLRIPIDSISYSDRP